MTPPLLLNSDGQIEPVRTPMPRESNPLPGHSYWLNLKPGDISKHKARTLVQREEIRNSIQFRLSRWLWLGFVVTVALSVLAWLIWSEIPLTNVEFRITIAV